MADRSSTRRKTAIAPAARSRATPARPRSAAQKSSERRGALIIGGAIILLAAFGVVMMETTPLWTLATPAEPTSVASATPDGDWRAAKITNLAGSGCTQQIFDNQTGRLVPSRQPCEANPNDSAEAAHRLDALSKSFASH
jgi:hypothetical protein